MGEDVVPHIAHMALGTDTAGEDEAVNTDIGNHDEELARDASVALSSADQDEVRQLYEAFRRGNAKLIGPNGEARPLPGSLYSFLTELIGQLQQGRSIYIIQHQAKLTTIQAAAMLGVSRQFLVGLLERNEIPYHMVGTHRRIYAKDLLKYKADRDTNRARTIRDLAKSEAADGLYGVIPPE